MHVNGECRSECIRSVISRRDIRGGVLAIRMFSSANLTVMMLLSSSVQSSIVNWRDGLGWRMGLMNFFRIMKTIIGSTV
jgi:hypothetical protein